MLKEILLIVIVLVQLAAVGLIVRLSMVLNNENLENNKNDICLTPQCVHIASTTLEFMDFTSDPCEDFYNFTCGNYMKIAQIPDDKHSITSFSSLDDLIEVQLKTEIEKPIQSNQPRAFMLAKRLYDACMNLTKIEEIGLKEIKYALVRFGGWPVLQGDSWREKTFDWKETIYKIRNEGYSGNYLITFYINSDQKKSTKNMIYLDDANLGLNEKLLKKGRNHELVRAYSDYMVDIAIIFGANRAQAKMELLESLKFEMDLAQISLTSEQRLNPLDLYNPRTIQELEAEYPSVAWLDYINNLMVPYARVTGDEVISITSPEYIRNFVRLMNVTPKRTVANYLMWRVVQSSVFYLTEEVRNRQFKYYTAASGTTLQKPRWRQCISLVEIKLPSIIGAVYVRNYFDQDSKKAVEELADNIQAEFKEILENTDWMDEQTKRNALKKLDSVVMHIAYPHELLDNAIIDNLYKTLSIDSSKLWKSAMKISLFWRTYTLSRFYEPVNKTDWIDYSYVSLVNAYAQSSRNSIEIPAAVLQGLFFHKDYPNYINYGSIGQVIGHEITHLFDDSGRLYDGDGNLIDWGTSETREAYLKKIECFKDQYGNYTVPEVNMKVNGLETLNENIADIIGIKEAYLAYNRWVKEYGEELKLPGFSNYTRRQLFWIAAGVTWCSKRRPERTKQHVLLDPHAPPKYRLWGLVRNTEEFAKDFKCKSNAKMNPVKKCQLW